MPNIKNILQKYTRPATFADVVLILAHVLKKPKEFILAHQEYRPSPIAYLRITVLIHWYRQGRPIAYLTGHKEFYGLDFLVNRNTLIPRPDTEVMVEKVCEEIGRYSDRAITLVDVGTGSGCIPIAIYKTAIEQSNNRTIEIIATDISRPALRIAKKNAQHHNVPITFLHGNLLEPYIALSPYRPLSHLIITANLPYGWSEWKNNSSVESRGLKFEPKQALFTGEYGLQLYRELLEQIRSLLLIVHCSLLIFLEFDPRQTQLLTDLIHKILPTASVKIKTDLAGRDRLAIILVDS